MSAEHAQGLTNFGFGRIIDYPWLTRAVALVALSSSDWDTASGCLPDMHDNHLVGTLLTDAELIERLRVPIDRLESAGAC
ncbi:MAG: hypothetical protein CMO26_00415 [Thiotrichales bacterium]|nr:hypothetical protein [Thiotrichales bacterium]